jgi:hypothetical protein
MSFPLKTNFSQKSESLAPLVMTGPAKIIDLICITEWAFRAGKNQVPGGRRANKGWRIKGKSFNPKELIFSEQLQFSVG